jgi:hypothetical protein
VAQLNRSTIDLLSALVTRWIAYIRLFDFKVRYFPRNKHIVADGLSQRPRTDSNDIDEEHEVDIDDFINAKLNAFSVAPIAIKVEDLLEDRYLKDSWRIAWYLTTL